jgi:thiamine biosynthesis lipoprotein
MNERGRLLNSSYASEPFVKERFLLDTLVTIKAYGKDGKKVENAVAAAFEEMARVEKKMNYYNPKSELSLINRRASKQPLSISAEMSGLINLSLVYHQKTAGAFDITIGPLMDLWSFGQNEHVPDRPEIDEVLPLVGSQNIRLDLKDRKIQLIKPKVKLDLGGVAKGHAVDQAIAIIKKHGIKSALVTTGSTTKVIGLKPGREAWKIGIENPRSKNDIIGVLELKDDESVSTSGDYQQFFIKKGKRYHHILDPKTGQPARGCMSVTVLTSRSCAEADIMSTAIFVLGYPEGMKYVEKNTDLEAMIVTADGKVHLSKGLRGKVEELERSVNRGSWIEKPFYSSSGARRAESRSLMVIRL